MRVSVVLPIVAMMAATIASSSQAFAKPGSWGGSQPPRPAPVVRDHRSTPVVRDHRQTPTVRDHRAPAPKVTDHRKRGGVTVTNSGAPRKASKSR
jgi:hypothetical protein